MSIAGRKGKFNLQNIEASIENPAWERLEDMLTADVFGAYRYLPLEFGLHPFLSLAKDDSDRTVLNFLDSRKINLNNLKYARIIFWPHFNDGSEPDLLILLGESQDKLRVAILGEAKLHSSQHEIELDSIKRSQLGHYSICHLNGSYAYDEMPQLEELPDVRIMLYITSGEEIPFHEIKVARNEIINYQNYYSEDDVGLFWCSWIKAGKEAQRLWHRNKHEINEKPWLRLLYDLYQDISARDLLHIEPFKEIPKFNYLLFNNLYPNVAKIIPLDNNLPITPYSQKRLEYFGSSISGLKMSEFIPSCWSFNQRKSYFHNFDKLLDNTFFRERQTGIPIMVLKRLPENFYITEEKS